MIVEETFQQRAERRRRTWTDRLGHDERAAQASDSTVAERVSCMAAVAESAWAIAGLPMPEYSRAEMPGRVIRTWDR